MLRQIIRAGNLSWSSYLKTESIKQVPQFPLRIYFKSFTSKLNDEVRQFQLFCPWMKSYGLTIQTKSLQQHFHKVLFIQYVVLTFESVDEILQCNHSNEPLQQYFHMVLFIQYVVLTFESVDQILQCDHQLSFNFQQNFHLVLFVSFHGAFFHIKLGRFAQLLLWLILRLRKCPSWFYKAKWEEQYRSQTLVYAQYEIGLV